MCPGFPMPPDLDYTGYHRYIDERLPSESPGLYGMHPNAEIEFMTATSDALFKTLLELQPRDSSTGEGASQCIEEKVKPCATLQFANYCMYIQNKVFFLMCFKEVSYTYKSCIYLINAVKIEIILQFK